MEFNPSAHRFRSVVEFEDFLTILDCECPVSVYYDDSSIGFSFLHFNYICFFSDNACYGHCLFTILQNEHFISTKCSDVFYCLKDAFLSCLDYEANLNGKP